MKSYGQMLGISSGLTSGGVHKSRPFRGIRASRLLYMVAAVLLFGVFLTFVNIYELRRLQGKHYGRSEVEPTTSVAKRKIFWVHGKNLDSGYLHHVFVVFERLGYIRGLNTSDWDILWSHDYPFTTLKNNINSLKPHQRVNHFPGSGYVTNKVNLATLPFTFIPKAFRIPRETWAFKQFAAKHPLMYWVQKSNSHRGVKVLPFNDLDLKSENTFIQEYVDQPLLIDGRRFDIGIYVAITSINPLRIYMNAGDWLVRFCPVVYDPFDPKVLGKYVVNDNYMPMWKIPSLKRIFDELKLTFRNTLLTHLDKYGYDTAKLQDDIAEAIRSIYINQEHSIFQATGKYRSIRNFFEMVRFDFVLDETLKIYLLEVNMSPNLSSGHFATNKLLYEQVMFGFLNLVGIGRSVHNDLPQSFEDEANMQVSDRDIHVYGFECNSPNCMENCSKMDCRLCSWCLTNDSVFTYKRAFLEYVNRRTWKRVMPIPMKKNEGLSTWNPKNDHFFTNLTAKNQNMFLWFRGKCLDDSMWCS